MSENALAPETVEPTSPPGGDPPPQDQPGDIPPPSDPSSDSPPGGDPPKSRAEQRIEDLIAQNKADREAMQEYADYWRQQALKQAAPPAPQPPADDPAPTLDKFDSTEAWARAHAEWTQRELDRRASAAVERRLAEARQAETQEQVVTQWQSRLTEFAKAAPDAVAVISNPRLKISDAMREVITASELGPQLAYHLGKNPLEAARISRLPAVQAAKEMGKLEAQLTKPAAPKPPPRTNAPPPPTPIDGGGVPSVDPSKMSLSEYLEHRAQRRQAKGRV